MRHSFLAGIALSSVVGIAGPALAKDTVTIAVGGGTVPRYEGSDRSTIIPAVGIRGTVSGIAFTSNGTGIDTDVIPRKAPTGGKLLLGPVAHLTYNRSSLRRIRDAQIIALGKIKPTVELGAQIGYTQTGVVTSDYDTLTVAVAYLHDVTGIHDSGIVTPSISYGTPLSQRSFVGLSASADHVESDYARTYFGVTPGQSTASGLRAYDARGGWKDFSISGVANYALSGDLRKGVSLFAIANHEWLLGNFKRSPIVKQSGQWYVGGGVAYTF